MKSRIVKGPRVRAIALAVGAFALSSLVFASSSFAAAPPAGTACQASDGKINGRGATFQTDAQQKALIPGYTSDVCGPVTSDTDAGVNMIASNYAAAVAAGATGSGAGQKAALCRTDAFSGTDIPYTEAVMGYPHPAPAGSIDGPVMTPGTSPCNIAFSPPFQPTPGPWPNAADTQADAMSFPVAGSSVAIGVNLTAADCGGTAPGSLNLTLANVSALFGGSQINWNDPSLTANNPSLVNCNVPVQRVVRLDNSGTTETFKHYLQGGLADSNGTTALCDASTWNSVVAAGDTANNNSNWPTGASCSNLVKGASSGAPALLTALQGTDGGVGYADFADWASNAAPESLDALQNSTATSFVTPGSGSAANCAFTGATMPGTTAAQAVGLDGSGANWATDAASNKSNVTFKGTGYPACGFTWDLVFTHLNDGSVANPNTRLTADQRRTMYSYFTYVLSPAAQARLPLNGYASLPGSFLTRLRQGFQGNF